MVKWLPWVACGILAAMAFFLKFCIPGYSFSALLCCIAIGILLFYTCSKLLLPRFPGWMPWVRRVFTLCLILGCLVVARTEAVILHYSQGQPTDDVQYVVVLGAKVREEGPSVSLWDRIFAARDFLKENPHTVAILSGGQGADEPMTEARAMYDELVLFGIDESRLWLEEEATSTWENLNFSLDLIEARTGSRPEKLGVLSSEYHLFRASLFTRACGVEFAGIPARTSRWGQRINHFLRESAGVWHYLILGGQYD